MLEPITGLPPSVDGLKAVGKLSKQDYERVFEPLIEQARQQGRRLRLLYQLGPEFDGFTPGAAWEDAKLGLRSLQVLDGCTIVTDIGWIRESAKFVGFIMPCPVKVFGNHEVEAAARWLSELPRNAGVSHRIIAQTGVVVVEIESALKAQDFDSVAMTVDNWIAGHGSLQGLVLHVRTFPGWENLGSLLRHVRFIREHYGKLRRVALATEGKLASLGPHFGEHFVKAEVKSFGYTELEAAIAWAGADPNRAVPTPALHTS